MSYACPKNLTGERIKPEKEKKKKKRKGQRYIKCNNSLFIFSYIIFIVHHQLYLFVFTTQYHLLFTNISCSDDLYDSGSDDESYSQPTKRYAFLISPPLLPPFTAINATHHFFYYVYPFVSTLFLNSFPFLFLHLCMYSVQTPGGPKGVSFVRSAATPSASPAPSPAYSSSTSTSSSYSSAPSSGETPEEKKTTRKKLSSGYFSDEDNLSD